MLTESDCTVFNRVLDSKTRLDIITVAHIYGVHWEESKAVNVIKSGTQDADSVVLYVPFSARMDKPYKPPKEFKRNSEGSFTFKNGDIIAKGIVDFEGSPTKILETFDSVFTIQSVDTYAYGSQAMQHWKISGK